MLKSLTIAALAAAPFILSAQTWDVGLSANASNYQGDVVKPLLFTLQETNLCAGVFVRRNFDDLFSLRGNALFGRLTGNDANFPEDPSRTLRGFSFRTTLIEFSIQGELGLLRPQNAAGQNRPVIPYLFAGFGYAGVNAAVNFNEPNLGTSQALIREDRKNASQGTVAFPIGLGFRFPIGEKNTLGFEAGFRPTVSDYLDGVSKTGNPNKNDWYIIGGLNLAFNLGKSRDSDGDGVPDNKDKCPYEKGLASDKGCPEGRR
jgi:OmpA-OmpF porin, OOP family